MSDEAITRLTGALPLIPDNPEWHGEVCITCSDQGIPAEVVRIPSGPLDLATVRTATGEEEVDVMLVGPVAEGDIVLIHGGTALTRLETP